ncbi:hypothetical protein HJC23_001195 [Cyclotella cryptica]|uniref:DUF6824 domain-containing protein n=1 Tax=Cyclotella cryptica TaxID=29204 RepID=A0ABD3QNM4_9STRA|eukprot:CCRYP_003853-RA/>CCRYP_003853-RA protein AED:0.02 eAED:0.02 QI:183/1/1/1/0/0/2/391/561
MFRYDDNQATGITVIGENDIVCGRGGAALKHSGNLAYRKIVSINKTLYATCLKAEKLRISKSIVAAIREVNGRFLEREDGKISTTLDEKNPDGSPVTWRDIGDRRAIEKTSQALREGQPKLLKKLQQGEVDQSQISINGTNNFSTSNDVNYDAKHPVSNGLQDSVHYDMETDIHSPVPTLPQISAPIDEQMNYEYGQTQVFQSSPTPTASFSGGNPAFLKQDSFQMMIGDEISSHGNGDPLPDPTSQQMNRHQDSDHPKQSVTSYNDSWQAHPTPLPFQIHSSINMGKDDSKHLLQCLDLESKRYSVNSNFTNNSQGSYCHQDVSKKRPSVSFKRGRDSLISLGSHFSEFSNWDTHSLDSAMDIAEREVDLQLLGDDAIDFDWGNSFYENNLAAREHQASQVENEASAHQGEAIKRFSIGFANGEAPKRGSIGFAPFGDLPPSRGSILRRTPRFSISQNAFPYAALNEADPGMLFTSTFDTKPGGVNSGTDVSGLFGERRKSAVAFELMSDQQRRMSTNRISNFSMFSEIGSIYRRDVGSTMSIQSADIRELIDMDDDDEL